jgi:hypothetical protein
MIELQERSRILKDHVMESAKEKAQAGLGLIEQAILQLLREKGPMQPHDVEDALSLRWESPEGSGKQHGVCYAIMLKMAEHDGPLTTEGEWHPKYFVRPRSTHS